jgi:hypothetical protein
MVAPVCGLRPSRAERSEVENVPNPTNETLPPLDKVADTRSVKESKAFLAAALEMPASSAIASIRSALFIFVIFLVRQLSRTPTNLTESRYLPTFQTKKAPIY